MSKMCFSNALKAVFYWLKSEIFEEYKRFGKSIVLEVYRFEDAQKSRRKRWAEASSRLDIKAVKVEKF